MPFSNTFPRGLRSTQFSHNIFPTETRSSSFPPVPCKRSSACDLFLLSFTAVATAGMNLCMKSILLLSLSLTSFRSLGNYSNHSLSYYLAISFFCTYRCSGCNVFSKSLRTGSSHLGNIRCVPSSSGFSSKANPGGFVAISKRTPPGSLK